MGPVVALSMLVAFMMTIVNHRLVIVDFFLELITPEHLKYLYPVHIVFSIEHTVDEAGRG